MFAFISQRDLELDYLVLNPGSSIYSICDICQLINIFKYLISHILNGKIIVIII